MAILRLNYACDLRYGVLVDIATKVWTGQQVDVSMGYLNTIWQGDANAMTLCAFGLLQTPAHVLNMTGPEIDLGSFLQTPLSTAPYNPAEELATYRQKYSVPVQRPWVEFWRPYYAPGIFPPANDFFGKTNLLFPHFYVYGDYRTGGGVNRNQAGNARSWAHRLNLDMNLGLTATERIHAFMGPLDNGTQ